jgi:hypothetical protein
VIENPAEHFVVPSGNLRLMILIRKWLGLATLAFTFALNGAMAEGSSRGKSPGSAI